MSLTGLTSRCVHWAAFLLEALEKNWFPSLFQLLEAAFLGLWPYSKPVTSDSILLMLLLLWFSFFLLPSSSNDPCDYTGPIGWSRIISHLKVNWLAPSISPATVVDLCHETEDILRSKELVCRHLTTRDTIFTSQMLRAPMAVSVGMNTSFGFKIELFCLHIVYTLYGYAYFDKLQNFFKIISSYIKWNSYYLSPRVVVRI